MRSTSFQSGGGRYITNPKRIEKKYTQIDGDIAVPVTAKGQSNWTGTFISDRGAKVERTGYIEKGTGLHQSNEVFSQDGLARAVQARDFKGAMMIEDE